LVAVSGGADSVALLDVLGALAPELRLTLHVVHVHHGLRPEAAADAAFVEAYAARLGCPVATSRVTIEPGGGRSPEDAARVARHAALGRLAARLGADRIALGHTADDQAETVLMRALQGAGPRGLAGIPIRRGGLIRPLLEADRAAVRAHLAVHGLAHVEDLTNDDPRFLRNRVRHVVLPALARMAGPGLPAALCRLARASRETVEALEALLAPRLAAALQVGPGGWTLSGAALAGLPPGGIRALLRLALTGRTGLPGLRAPHLDALAGLIEGVPGAQVRLPGGVRVERTRAGLFIAPRGPDPDAVPLAAAGTTLVPWAWLRLETVVDAGLGAGPGAPSPAPPPGSVPRAGTAGLWEASLDADALPAALEVRPWRAGDRMRLAPGGEPLRLSRGGFFIFAVLAKC
jgi:tRNA(Ile)-lysidine synthase